MTTIADGLKDVFLAGVGAMALGAEKTQELVEQLIAKGEITVEQGKAINSEVLKQAQATAERVGQQAQTAVGEAAREPPERSGQDGRGVGSRADRGCRVHGALAS